jgi:hypothetical protein
MSRSFDFAVNAEKVIIKKQGKNKYKIKLAGVGDFLKYQTWSSTNTNNINGDRSVSLVHVKDWVQNNFGSGLIDVSTVIYPGNIFGVIAPLLNTTTPAGSEFLSSFAFAPTAVMEVNNQKYIFVIENASYNKKKIYNTVFNVSTNQIVKNNVSKHLVKLPIHKKLHKVRFDIDSSDTVSGSLTVNSVSSFGQVNNYDPAFTLNFKYYPNSQNSSRNRIRISSFTASASGSSVNGSNDGLNEWNISYPTILLCSKPRSVQCPDPDSGSCISCTATAYYDSVNKKINITFGTILLTFE